MSDLAAYLGKKERRKSSAAKLLLGDYQKLSQNTSIRKLMEKKGDKLIHFSDLVVKVNRKNKMQDRVLLVTDGGIYNLEPGSLRSRRRIPINSISHISMSNLSDNFFVIHVSMEYDYLLVSRRKIEIVTQICKAYQNATRNPLEVHIAPSFEYRIDPNVSREIRFTKVDMGVNTQIFVCSNGSAHAK